jgi:hypothetical protein
VYNGPDALLLEKVLDRGGGVIVPVQEPVLGRQGRPFLMKNLQITCQGLLDVCVVDWVAPGDAFCIEDDGGDKKDEDYCLVLEA